MISNQIADALILVPGPGYVIYSLSRMYGRAMGRGTIGIAWAAASSLSASLLGLFGTLFLGSMVVLAFSGVFAVNLSFAMTVDALSYLRQMVWPVPFFIATWIAGLFFGAKAKASGTKVGDFGRTEEAKP